MDEIQFNLHVESGTQLSKVEFDKLRKDEQFVEGPTLSSLGKWTGKFSPYDPQIWVFGKLANGRVVFRYCDAAEQKEKSDGHRAQRS